jgi:hypothetical protein
MNHSRAFQIYLGDDVHAYTPQVREVAQKYIPTLDPLLSDSEFSTLLTELERFYGPKPVYTNFRNTYHQGQITDPTIPGLNIATLLKSVWNCVKQINDSSIYRHFGETLDQIGMTCTQGQSHRLLIDLNALK